MRMNEIQLARVLDHARVFLDEDKRLHAIQVYFHLILDEPKFLQTYFELASVYAAMGNAGAAIAILMKAGREFPDSIEVMLQVGNYYLRMEEYDRALAWYKKLAGRKIPQVHFNMGLAYFYKNNIVRAEEQFRMTMAYDPAFPRIHESLGELLIKRGAFTEALDFLRRGITTDPYSAVNHFLLGTVYGKLEQWKKAYEEFVLAVDMDPNESIHWRMCGEALVHLKRYAEAEPYLRKSLDLSPESVDALVLLGELFIARHEVEHASQVISRALRLDPRHPGAKEAQWALRRQLPQKIKK